MRLNRRESSRARPYPRGFRTGSRQRYATESDRIPPVRVPRIRGRRANRKIGGISVSRAWSCRAPQMHRDRQETARISRPAHIRRRSAGDDQTGVSQHSQEGLRQVLEMIHKSDVTFLISQIFLLELQAGCRRLAFRRRLCRSIRSRANESMRKGIEMLSGYRAGLAWTSPGVQRCGVPCRLEKRAVEVLTAPFPLRHAPEESISHKQTAAGPAGTRVSSAARVFLAAARPSTPGPVRSSPGGNPDQCSCSSGTTSDRVPPV